ncbi:rhodanese-like domain-containing protein [Beijerinckia indica]|uniref:Rhodanese domain protein n=1 Tax=Beijerinckia indica subsp. indica (strain ATCC 9039 / DSM 1715 / NCIMB 8712) TaxID=395963 RepID=B2IIU1_BEII9|nr:rhodanese-like domain-containing protein [Beijerinckia indica]ACB96153.1 Rhodanese domain protein [Beijerinckia indica subsp. indica ATCC 9039]
MSIREINRAALQTWLSEGTASRQELALLDVRPEEAFGKGHPFFGTNLPLNRLEQDVSLFVPRKAVRLVLVDAGDGDSEKAAAILDKLGYSDINILKGGVPAWTEESLNGQPTFDIPGIVFSESVRDAQKTPSISATELNALYASGADVVVLDTRTIEEFAAFHVPRARSLPGAEILHRFLDYVPSPDTLVVISCAGLPRAIIGAQTLIDADVPNRVVLLEEGTTGWKQAGFELESGLQDQFGPVTPRAAAFGEERARVLTQLTDVEDISPEEVAEWLADDSRTTYVLDVRLPQDFARGHWTGSVSAQGGQLLAVSHRSVAVRDARLILIDEHGTQAVTTAYWLRRRGWEVRIFSGALAELRQSGENSLDAQTVQPLETIS